MRSLHATIYAVSRRLIVKLGGKEDSIAPLRSVFSKEQERVVEELQQQVRFTAHTSHTSAYVLRRIRRIRQHTVRSTAHTSHSSAYVYAAVC